MHHELPQDIEHLIDRRHRLLRDFVRLAKSLFQTLKEIYVTDSELQAVLARALTRTTTDQSTITDLRQQLAAATAAGGAGGNVSQATTDAATALTEELDAADAADAGDAANPVPAVKTPVVGA